MFNRKSSKRLLHILFAIILLVSNIQFTTIDTKADTTQMAEDTQAMHSRAPASIFESNISLSGPGGTYTGSLNAKDFQVDIVKYDWTTIPRITEIHSWNAAMATLADQDVYFIPKLEDFPTDITTLLQRIKFVYYDENGEGGGAAPPAGGEDEEGNTGKVATKVVRGFSAIETAYFDDEVIYSSDGTANDFTATQNPDLLTPDVATSFGMTTHITNKKKVYSSVMNSRALELMGYDLLLESEKYVFPGTQSSLGKEGDDENGIRSADTYDINNTPVRGYDPLDNDMYAAEQNPLYVQMLTQSHQYKLAASNSGTGYIKTKTAVMDLYKALGQYYWDINFHFFRTNQPTLENRGIQGASAGGTNEYALRDYNYSSIVQKLTQPIATSIGPESDHHGESPNYETPIMNTDAGITMVAATRTNPDLYWDAAQKDMVFGGGAHNARSIFSYVGESDAASFTKNPESYLTIGEFCEIARAMMELYGEPVMTENEQLMMVQNYGMTLPTNLTAAQNQAVRYLAAKGVLDPTGIDFSQNLRWTDMSELLIRIADPDSRLTFKEVTWNTDSVLFKNGYLTGNYGGISDIEDMQEVIDVASAMYYDYFIESEDNLTNFVLTETTTKGTKYSVVTDNIALLTVDSTPENQIPLVDETGAMFSEMPEPIVIPSEDETTPPVTITPEYYPLFINDGITEEGFYHFKIRKDVATDTSGGSFEFDRDPAYQPMNFVSPMANDAVDGAGYIKIGYAKPDQAKIVVGDEMVEDESLVLLDAIIPKYQDTDLMGDYNEALPIEGYGFYYLQAGGGIYTAVPKEKTNADKEKAKMEEAVSETTDTMEDGLVLNPTQVNNVYVGTKYINVISALVPEEGYIPGSGRAKKISYTVNGKKSSESCELQQNSSRDMLGIKIRKKLTSALTESAELKVNITYQYYDAEQKKQHGEVEITYNFSVSDAATPEDPEHNFKYRQEQYKGEDLPKGTKFLMHYTLDGYEWPNGFIGGYTDLTGIHDDPSFGKSTRKAIIDKMKTRTQTDILSALSGNSVSRNKLAENPSIGGDTYAYVESGAYDSDYDPECVLGYKMGPTYVDQSREFAVYQNLTKVSGTGGDADLLGTITNQSFRYFRQLSDSNTTAMMFSMSRKTWDDNDFGSFSLFGVGMANQLKELYDNSFGLLKGTSTVPYRYENISTPLLLHDINDSRVYIIATGVTDYDVFKNNFSTNSKKAGTGTAIYFKPGNNSDDVLLDADILLREKLIQKFNIDNNNLSFVGAHNANVFINQCYPGGYIIVGNTYFPLQEDEIGFLHVGNKYYINIKAVMGWAIKSKALVSEEGVLELVVPSQATEAFDDSSFLEGSKYSIYGADGIAEETTFWKGWNGRDCMLLTSSYCLSNYMVVMSPEPTEHMDAIFYWRIRPTLSNGQYMTDGAQPDAADMWRKLTGTSPPEYDPNYYQLNYKLLDRTATSYQDGVQIGFLTQDVRDLDGCSNAKASIGYGFYPRVCSTVYEAINAACGPDALPIPVSYVGEIGNGGGYFNGLLNTYSVNADLGDPQSYLGFGVMPAKILGNSSVSDNTVAIMTMTNTKQTNDYWDVQRNMKFNEDEVLLNNGYLLPQPVGAFLPVHPVETETYYKVQSTQDPIYVGTMLATRMGTSLTIGDLSLGNSTKVELTPALLSANSDKTVYTYPISATKTREVENGEGTNLFSIVSEANKLVDWDAYKFNRLISSFDMVTSILMIFVLNIFPRIGMWCFMILLALTTFKGNKLIEKFINKVFDPVKLISFGHQTFYTIDLKRMVIQSMLALSIFMVIMDGHLINFISWCVSFGAILGQR